MPFVFKAQKICPEGDDTANTFVDRMCDFASCRNFDKLSKCARCKTAMYCSKECQRKDWPNHKTLCNFNQQTREVAGYEGMEPPLRRHLRHFTARYGGSLVCAAIVALDLYRKPSNIDAFGMVVTLYPRPHAEVGSRFTLVSADVVPMDEITEIMSMTPGSVGIESLSTHKRERAALRKRSGGEEDFATMVIIALNKGSTPLPGEEHGIEIRFKPLAISRKLVRSPQLVDVNIAWYASLHYQIDQDIPSRGMITL